MMTLEASWLLFLTSEVHTIQWSPTEFKYYITMALPKEFVVFMIATPLSCRFHAHLRSRPGFDGILQLARFH